ncbi:hypothetical protein [Wenyingzhuangia sp. IMCC45574]
MWEKFHYLIIIFIVTVISLVVISFIQYPFFLRKTTFSEGTIISYKTDYAIKFDPKRPISAWKYQYIFKTEDKYVVDWAVRERKKEMYLSKKVKVKYWQKNPLINETKTFYSNEKHYKLYETVFENGYAEIELINNFFIYKKIENLNKVERKKYGEFEITNDTLKLYSKPNKRQLFQSFLVTNDRIVNLENKMIYSINE